MSEVVEVFVGPQPFRYRGEIDCHLSKGRQQLTAAGFNFYHPILCVGTL